MLNYFWVQNQAWCTHKYIILTNKEWHFLFAHKGNGKHYCKIKQSMRQQLPRLTGMVSTKAFLMY